ncbi:MAG: hypothetical protein HY904_15220 [Deltaproteobacteria bacterium]|nr:hypothetical protein [Deltaproteobacteria bacterium]
MIESLVAVLVILYLVELCFALPPHAIVFSRPGWGRFSVATAAERGLEIRGRTRLVLAPPLPLGCILVTEVPPLHAAPDGLVPSAAFAWLPLPPPATAAAVPYSQVSLRRVGTTLLLAGGTRTRWASEPAATLAADAPNAVAGGTERAWQRWLQENVARSDEGAIRTRVGDFRRATLPLRVLCTLLFAFLFGVIPVTALLHLPWSAWHLVAYVALLGGIQVFAWRVGSRFYPADRAKRWTRVFTMLVSPAELMCVPHALSRDLLAGHDPLAVAGVLLDGPRFADAAARALRGAHFGTRLPVADRERLEGIVRRHGLAAAELVAAPTQEAGSRVYCPRCHEQLTLVTAECRNCAGVPMVEFRA